MPFDTTILDELDDYTGQPVATAQAALEALGLTVRLDYDYDGAVAEGLVLDQDIIDAADSHEVLLVVSLGPGAFFDPRRIAFRIRGVRPRPGIRIRYAP